MAGPFSDSVPDLLETILHQCAEANPHPWYPKHYAENTGTARDQLDLPLENLRMAGLIRITDWVQGSGQGYVLTPAGAEVLNNPRLLSRMRNGQLPTASPEPELPPLQERTRPYQESEQLHEEFVNAGTPIVSRALLLLNVIVFIVGYAMAMRAGLPAGVYFKGSPGNQEQLDLYSAILHDTGGLRTVDIVAGQWWRLLTCAFVHRGLLHLGMNMFGVYALGQVLERMWGRWRFLTIYLVSALGGSVAAMIFGPFPGGVVGASGALCGMLASVATFIFLNRRRLPEEDVARWRRNLITNFILILIISFVPGVSKEAHFGGAVVGLIVGVPLNMQRFSRGGLRWLAVVAVLAVPTLCLGPLLYVTKTDERWIDLDAAYRRLQELQREHARQKEAEKEELDFRERFVSRKDEAEKKARKADGAAYELLVQPPMGRSDQKVAKTLAAIKEAQEEADALVEDLKSTVPYQHPVVEKNRQRFIEYLEARSTFCALAAAILKDRQHYAGKEKEAYDQQWQKIQALLQQGKK